jgi:hypothetical protein
MSGKFIANVGLLAIASLPAAFLGINLMSSVPAAGHVLGARAEPITLAEFAFCVPKKAQYGDQIVYCGRSPGKF